MPFTSKFLGIVQELALIDYGRALEHQVWTHWNKVQSWSLFRFASFSLIRWAYYPHVLNSLVESDCRFSLSLIHWPIPDMLTWCWHQDERNSCAIYINSFTKYPASGTNTRQLFTCYCWNLSWSLFLLVSPKLHVQLMSADMFLDFNDTQCQATKDTGTITGLEVLCIINSCHCLQYQQGG